MCLAIPAQIVAEPNDNSMAEVDILGVRRHVSLMMTPAAKLGNHVLVHAGFAIEVVDEAFAAETLDMLRSMGIKSAQELEAELTGEGTESVAAVPEGTPAS